MKIIEDKVSQPNSNADFDRKQRQKGFHRVFWRFCVGWNDYDQFIGIGIKLEPIQRLKIKGMKNHLQINLFLGYGVFHIGIWIKERSERY